jgi:anti-anti-sigma factor
MDLKIAARTVGDRHVVTLDGLADLSTVPTLMSRLWREVASANGATVVIDIDGLVSLDDVALGVFLGAAANAREHGGDLEVLTTSPRWRDRFRATRFEHAVTVRDRID